MTLSNDKKIKNNLEEIKDVVKASQEEIKREFFTTSNSWVACFCSQIFLIETYFYSPKIKELMSERDYKKAEENLNELRREYVELKKEYPDKIKTPPEELRNRLMARLDILDF